MGHEEKHYNVLARSLSDLYTTIEVTKKQEESLKIVQFNPFGEYIEPTVEGTYLPKKLKKYEKPNAYPMIVYNTDDMISFIATDFLFVERKELDNDGVEMNVKSGNWVAANGNNYPIDSGSEEFLTMDEILDLR